MTTAPVGFAAVENQDKGNRGGRDVKRSREEDNSAHVVRLFKEKARETKSEVPESWKRHMGTPGRLPVQPLPMRQERPR